MTKRKNAWKDQGKNIASRRKYHEQCNEWDWEWCEVVAGNNGRNLYSPVELIMPEGELSLISEPLWEEVACQWGWLASGEHQAGCDPGCCSERAPQINCNHMNLLKSQTLLLYCCYNWTKYILLCSHFVLSKVHYLKIQ